MVKLAQAAVKAAALIWTIVLGISHIAGPAGCPQPQEPRILVWPRIRKTGSTTVLTVLWQLAKQNNFTLDAPYSALMTSKRNLLEPYKNHTVAREAFAAALTRPGKTLLVDHFGFPSVESPEIAYINVLREPIERCISQYYYLRFGTRPEVLKEKEQRNFNGSAEECLQLEHEANLEGKRLNFSCCGESDMQARYLAGPLDDPVILTLQGKALASRALLSVEKHFPMVGTTDDLEDTLVLLERTFPGFFKGAVKVFQSIRRKNMTAYKKLEPEVKARLASWFETDTEVFHFVKRRFQAQRAACGIVESGSMLSVAQKVSKQFKIMWR